VYQINEGCRRGPTLGLQTIATDMWEPFLRVIAERVPWAINVLNRYHITANVNKAVDKVRAEEAPALARKGTPVLKYTRCLLLKSPENFLRQAKPGSGGSQPDEPD